MDGVQKRRKCFVKFEGHELRNRGWDEGKEGIMAVGKYGRDQTKL